MKRRVTNRFEKGSGAYKCRCCGRQTRSTGRGDNEFLNLCAECYDLGGLENALLDGEDPNDPKLRQQVQELCDIIRAKGGTPQWDEFPEMLT